MVRKARVHADRERLFKVSTKEISRKSTEGKIFKTSWQSKRCWLRQGKRAGGCMSGWQFLTTDIWMNFICFICSNQMLRSILKLLQIGSENIIIVLSLFWTVFTSSNRYLPFSQNYNFIGIWILVSLLWPNASSMSFDIWQKDLWIQSLGGYGEIFCKTLVQIVQIMYYVIRSYVTFLFIAKVYCITMIYSKNTH